MNQKSCFLRCIIGLQDIEECFYSSTTYIVLYVAALTIRVHHMTQQGECSYSYVIHPPLPVSKTSRFSCNSEAFASEFLENLEEVFLVIGIAVFNNHDFLFARHVHSTCYIFTLFISIILYYDTIIYHIYHIS